MSTKSTLLLVGAILILLAAIGGIAIGGVGTLFLDSELNSESASGEEEQQGTDGLAGPGLTDNASPHRKIGAR